MTTAVAYEMLSRKHRCRSKFSDAIKLYFFIYVIGSRSGPVGEHIIESIQIFESLVLIAFDPKIRLVFGGRSLVLLTINIIALWWSSSARLSC